MYGNCWTYIGLRLTGAYQHMTVLTKHIKTAHDKVGIEEDGS